MMKPSKDGSSVFGEKNSSHQSPCCQVHDENTFTIKKCGGVQGNIKANLIIITGSALFLNSNNLIERVLNDPFRSVFL